MGRVWGPPAVCNTFIVNQLMVFMHRLHNQDICILDDGMQQCHPIRVLLTRRAASCS